MLISDFHFDLPEELIAQHALADRAASRMLHVKRSSNKFDDHKFSDFPELLKANDLLVFNNTKVFPARLFARRSGERAQPVSQRNPAAREFLQGTAEVLLNRQVGPWEWEALVRPGRKIGLGEKLFFYSDEQSRTDHPALVAEVMERGSFGERRLRFNPVPDFFAVLDRVGHVPLPPYIRRDDTKADRERYQTIYARKSGSAAAPTAGLHFTPEILERIRARGIEIAEITLHVGLGTFQPLRNEQIEQNTLHKESFELSEGAARQINQSLERKRRIVAVGTTTVRALEFAARNSAVPDRLQPMRGEADIFIYPGFQFRIVNALLTNFHLPKSSLLVLVSAFAGRDLVLNAYRHAVAERYRFFSYGDCMFIE
ncbi:MAG TPA: tRNA preQ1(34) S-adenosylmethionine ribosyltransferase-isomerase QueA [Terriglobales bacterium]